MLFDETSLGGKGIYSGNTLRDSRESGPQIWKRGMIETVSLSQTERSFWRCFKHCCSRASFPFKMDRIFP